MIRRLMTILQRGPTVSARSVREVCTTRDDENQDVCSCLSSHLRISAHCFVTYSTLNSTKTDSYCTELCTLDVRRERYKGLGPTRGTPFDLFVSRKLINIKLQQQFVWSLSSSFWCLQPEYFHTDVVHARDPMASAIPARLPRFSM